ncbi:MAG: putative uracil glycosylase superfamily protein [Nitrososphaeraceae archaeon]|jgi:uracil-DNA glycosylase|nr:putative uracil glycosylase superfamily protein [Nitrososphaeraceae archaeon]
MNKVSNDSLEKIASEVIGCPLCKLSRSRRNAVPGDGQLSSKIMFVGEAPGKNEDEQGKPFVGAAGMILNQALEKAGIKRAEVFITNVVKCRPPGNRVPENDERSICRQYLDRQISLIAPKIICILGSTAYSSILGGKSITKNRGKIMERNGQKYFLTIHPAAAIYNKNLRSVLNNDLFLLSKEIKKMEYDKRTSLLDYIVDETKL